MKIIMIKTKPSLFRDDTTVNKENANDFPNY